MGKIQGTAHQGTLQMPTLPDLGVPNEDRDTKMLIKVIKMTASSLHSKNLEVIYMPGHHGINPCYTRYILWIPDTTEHSTATRERWKGRSRVHTSIS